MRNRSKIIINYFATTKKLRFMSVLDESNRIWGIFCVFNLFVLEFYPMRTRVAVAANGMKINESKIKCPASVIYFLQYLTNSTLKL